MNALREHRLNVSRYILILAAVWTAGIVGSLGWNLYHITQNDVERARIQARIAYSKDLIYRRWNASHNGVYVPVTETTLPNPTLRSIDGLDELNIETPSGRKLTLINPAYMTRQVFEMTEQVFGTRGHLTSLKPLRAENLPDAWETKGLNAFEEGAEEVSSIERIEGQEYMRLMRPLLVEQRCMKCHESQGYEVGNVRGGLSVSVPMDPLRAISLAHKYRIAWVHVLLWIVGLIGLGSAGVRLRKAELVRELAEQELEENNLHLSAAKQEADLANHSKTEFLTNMSHEIRTPMNAILGFTEILEDRIADPRDLQCLSSISSSGKSLLILINSILDLSKIEAGKLVLEEDDHLCARDTAGDAEHLPPGGHQTGPRVLHRSRAGLPHGPDPRRPAS